MYVTTRRRFEGIGENHGFSACREYHFSGHERVLVLLRSHPAVGREHRRGGQNPSELRPHGGAVHSILYTKLFSVLLLALSCLGTKGVKGEKITWGRIWTAFAVGFVLFFLNWWLLPLPLPLEAVTGLYVLTIGTGYVCLLMGWSVDEPPVETQFDGGCFQQREREFHAGNEAYRKRVFGQSADTFLLQETLNNGWINVVNPFRASIVLGTPGSGKSYAVVNNFIKQQIEKGFSQYIYDFKYPDLSTIAYNHLLNHPDGYKVKPKFYVINFDDPRRSHRCNPIHPDFMEDITDAYESAYTIMLNLNKTWVQSRATSSWSHLSFCLPVLSGISKSIRTGSFARFPMLSSF